MRPSLLCSGRMRRLVILLHTSQPVAVHEVHKSPAMGPPRKGVSTDPGKHIFQCVFFPATAQDLRGPAARIRQRMHPSKLRPGIHPQHSESILCEHSVYADIGHFGITPGNFLGKISHPANTVILSIRLAVNGGKTKWAVSFFISVILPLQQNLLRLAFSAQQRIMEYRKLCFRAGITCGLYMLQQQCLVRQLI